MVELLKVRNNSKPNAVAGAIANILKTQKELKVQAIGAGSINQAIKAIAIARSFLILSGKDLSCIPIFAEVMIENQCKTAICFIVKRFDK